MKIPHLNHPFSKQDIAFIEKLEAIDLHDIKMKLIHPKKGMGWSQKQMEDAIIGYYIFLFLIYRYPKKLIVPSKEVDQVWHYHLLDIQKYAQDCNFLFGHFIEHFPYSELSGPGKESEKKLEEAFIETQELIIQHFKIKNKKRGKRGSCGHP